MAQYSLEWLNFTPATRRECVGRRWNNINERRGGANAKGAMSRRRESIINARESDEDGRLH